MKMPWNNKKGMSWSDLQCGLRVALRDQDRGNKLLKDDATRT
jgi:hypothetical protein